MKLNGWQRLWILLPIVYCIFIIGGVISKYPRVEKISHRSEFYRELSAKSANMILPKTSDDAEALKSARGMEVIGEIAVDERERPASSLEADEPMEIGYIEKMPNKHSIIFKPGTSDNNMKVASREYWRIVKETLRKERLRFLLLSTLFWLVLCLGLYALGWGLGWDRKGI